MPDAVIHTLDTVVESEFIEKNLLVHNMVGQFLHHVHHLAADVGDEHLVFNDVIVLLVNSSSASQPPKRTSLPISLPVECRFLQIDK